MTLERGDKLVLYTDGITEARNSSLAILGEEALQAALRKLSHHEAQRICDQVFFLVRDHVGGDRGLDDDLTILTVEYTCRRESPIQT